MSNSGRNRTSDEDILRTIQEHRAPAVGTTDIAKEVGVSRQAVYQRLQNLHEDGLVERYKVSRDTVWYVTKAGERYLDKD
jgi:predicted transcriptional regulator